MPRPLASPHDQNATFVELFFDLVFVFSVTQVVSLFHDHVDLATLAHAAILFWLIWWAWTQFTWALNAADTTHPLVEIVTLAATGVVFFMAVSVPNAFGEQALWFAVPYVVVRLTGVTLHLCAAGGNASQRAAVRTWAIVSSTELVAVIAGAIIGGDAQAWCWLGAIVLDLIAAGVSARAEGWNLHPEHFGERHGLFVIIALGETLIVVAAGLSGAEWTGELITIAVLGVLIVCTLWWTYFTCAKPELEAAMADRTGGARSRLARDVYSIAHFPMICGVIAYAVAMEHAIAHPHDPLDLPSRIALAACLILFVGGIVGAVFRAFRYLLIPRLVITGVSAAAILSLTTIPPLATLAIAFAGLIIICAFEFVMAANHEPADPDIPTD
jgi:low temperature requirement protein LtrA